jgi:hypothetical protein
MQRTGTGRARMAGRTTCLIGSAAALAIAVAGCGSSSSSSSATATAAPVKTTSKATAVVAHPRTIPGVASPKNAIPASTAGLKKLAVVPKGAGFSPHLAGLGKLPLTQAIQEVSGDLNHFWSSEFANSSVRWPQVQDVVVASSPVQTQCSDRPSVAPTDPMYLCWGQNLPYTFYWPVTFMQQRIATDAGGVNLAFTIAEMWSFLIQNLVGTSQQLANGQMTKGQWAQQTLCLTGIYVRSLNDRKLFEQGDQKAFDSFMSALVNVNGITAPDVSPQQLQQAFVAGFNSGSPGTCVQGGSGTPTTTTTTPTPSPGLPGTTT